MSLIMKIFWNIWTMMMIKCCLEVKHIDKAKRKFSEKNCSNVQALEEIFAHKTQ